MKNKTFSNIIKRVNEIQKVVNLTDKEVKFLLTPKRISRAELEIDNQRFPAWRILFNDTLGPGKGGVRF